MNRLNKPEDSYEIQATCPSCNEKLAGSIIGQTIKEEQQRAPRPGDFSICVHCGEPAKFGDDMKLEKISNLEREELATKNPEIAAAIMFIKSRMDQAQLGKNYEDQLDRMEADVRAWRRTHFDLMISIQYNYQKEVGVIGTLKQGIDNKFLTVNDHAMQMFNELGWLEDGPKMPTIIMVRVVLEHVFGKKEQE